MALHLKGSELAQLRSQLKIDQNELDKVVMQQPVLFDRVAERYTLLVSQRDAAKAELEGLFAELSLDIRKKAKGADSKITNDEVASRVAVNKEYQAQERKLNELIALTAQWATLRESFMQRGYMIRELCGLYASGYWGQTSMKGGATADITVSRVRRETMRK